MHNSFWEGLNLYNIQAEELTFDLHCWFKRSPCKCEDFCELQEDTDLDDSLFIQQVQMIWYSLIPALKRIQKKWPVLKKYFLDFLPKDAKENRTEKFLQKNARYQKICLQIQQENKTCAQIAYLFKCCTYLHKIPEVTAVMWSLGACFVH